MSFGSSNPPWQRNTLGNASQQNAITNIQPQLINSNFVGFQGLSMPNQAQQNNLTLVPQIGANITTLNNTSALFPNHQTIQYQNRSGLNPNAFVQTNQQIVHHQAQAQSNPQQAQNNANSATSQICNSSAFKWNSNLVQQVTTPNQGHSVNQYTIQSSQQQQPTRNNFPGYSSSQSQNSYAINFDRVPNTVRTSNHSSRQSSPPARRSSNERSSRREDEDRRRRREREKEREKEHEKRDDHSPVRRISPRRRTRPIPRYMVKIPKFSLNANEADILELRRRYSNLYIPSEYFYSRIRWSESFPCHAPFSIKKPSTFHIFHKSVENPNGPDNGAIFEPPDADDSFSAKVMLMSVPPMSEFYRKCLTSADEKERDDQLLHPSRLISFLVGVMGKNDTMAIGGAWSPSLDGPNPEKDPSVLIKTAIRTCKALTGIDLTPCTQWYRFVELYYRRVESVRKGRIVPARTQTVVIFLPDIRSCLPTRLEWDELSVKYKQHFEMKNRSNYDEDIADVDKTQSISKPDELTNDGSNNSISADIEMPDESNKSDQKSENVGDYNGQDKPSESTDETKATMDTDPGRSDTATADTLKDGKYDSTKINATHFSELDVKTMKIQDLRDQLEARGLLTKGLKNQLVARLSKALKAEENESASVETPNDGNIDVSETHPGSNSSIEVHECASNDSMEIDMADIMIIDEYDSTKNDSKHNSDSKRTLRSDRWLEKRYRLPENPQILCHPIPYISHDVRFTCEVRSLSILLDYRSEDKSKSCFEVSLFAELFNEMLMRDFGFNIYKVLSSMPETEQSEHEPKDKRDDDEPKEKRHRKDNDGESKSSKKDDSSSLLSHDKSKSETDKDSKSSKEARSRDKEKDKEKDKNYRERRISRRDDDSDDERSIDGKRRDTKKMVTVDPDLLLSFIYFDETYCGYIFSNHLEELFYSLGVRLSRSDVKKIINKVAPRSLFYRKLTDKPKDDATSATILSESIQNLEEIAKGNTHLLPIFDDGAPNETIVKKFEQSSSDACVEPSKAEQISEPNTTERHMIIYKGGLIDIEKLLLQLNRSEKAREETESRLTELTKTIAEIQSSNSKAKDKIKDLQSELKSCNRKIIDTESSLSSANKRCAEFYTVLCGIHDKVNPICNKSERTSSKKESSNRDKDRRDRDKEKEKEKEKERDKDKTSGTSVKQEKETKEKVKVIDSKSEIKEEKQEKQEKQEEN